MKYKKIIEKEQYHHFNIIGDVQLINTIKKKERKGYDNEVDDDRRQRPNQVVVCADAIARISLFTRSSIFFPLRLLPFRRFFFRFRIVSVLYMYMRLFVLHSMLIVKRDEGAPMSIVYVCITTRRREREGEGDVLRIDIREKKEETKKER